MRPVPVVALDVANGEQVITNEDRKAFEKLTEFIKTQSVPPRISVLAGEIIHHLRSAFDHLAWQLSSSDFQAQFPERIEFPVFLKKPERCEVRNIAKHKPCHYCRKIEGISSPSALARIDSLQPYRRAHPGRDPLWLIHDMDRFDKHRELILAVHIMKLNIAGNVSIPGLGEQMPWENRPRNVRFYGKPKVNMKIKHSAEITLHEFRGEHDESIIPTLNNFLRFTRNAIESFAEEFA